MLVLLGMAIIASLFYCYCVKPFGYWRDLGVEQGNPMWLFGHYWRNFVGLRNGPETFQKAYEQSPNARYTGIYRFLSPIFIVRDPELIKKITVKDFDAFTDHPELIPAEADPLWSKNLFSLTGSKWREMRTYLSPSFTSSKIRVMFEQMSSCAEKLVSHLLEKDQETVTTDLREIFSRYTNDVIASTVFGVRVDSLANPNNRFYVIGNEVANFSTFWKTFKMILFCFVPAIRNFMKIQFISDEAAAYFQGIIEDTIKTREERGIVRPDMLHLLLQARKGDQKQFEKLRDDTVEEEYNDSDKGNLLKVPPEITNEDITAHALVFFIGGLESVSSSISFTAYELAINPDVQEKLRREVHATLKECGGKATYEAILNMKYMDMVVSESFRKWPHFTALSRICTKSYTIDPVLPGEKPVNIEKGIELAIPVYAIQHDPKYYPDPERFDPERFSEENKRNILPYTYFPFGLGPRLCIGARFTLVEVKVVLFHLLSRFEIVPVKRTAVPLRFSKNTFINLRPIGGFWLGFKKMQELGELNEENRKYVFESNSFLIE